MSELALRIDVDFPVGLRRAVPFFLSELAARDCHATFCVVAGSNRPVAAYRRLWSQDYRRRLLRLGPRRVLAALGARGLAGGGRMLDDPAGRAAVAGIVAAGQELAAHGWDHAAWAAHCWGATLDELTADVARAQRALGEIAGFAVQGWASPNWRTRPDVLRRVAAGGATWLSDCWGSGPFVTLDEQDEPIPLPHLPVSLPSPETLMLVERLDERAAAERVVDAVERDRFGVACLHDYHEGLLRPGLFSALLDACLRRGVRVVTLGDAAARLGRSATALPRHRLTRGALPGFSGDVSWQGTEAR